MNTAKVVSIKVDTVKNAIDLYINECMDYSKNTARNYLPRIKEFFMFVYGKQLDELTWDDVLNIKYADTLNFRQHLKNKNEPTTINQKIFTMKSFYNHLKKFDNRINLSILDVKPLPENKVVNEIGALTEDEMQKLFNYCQGQRKGLIKQLAFKAMYVTGLRVTATLALKWSDTQQRIDHSTGEKVWTLYSRNDKGKEQIVSIPNWFYEELLQINGNNDKIFNINQRTLGDIIKKFAEDTGIESTRNISLHSIKKASIDKVWNTTRDIVKTVQQGKHANANTTIKNYVGKNDGLTSQASFYAFNENTDLSKLEELSKEELLEVIRRSGGYVQNQLLQNIKQ